jgi:hypothetical protein
MNKRYREKHHTFEQSRLRLLGVHDTLFIDVNAVGTIGQTSSLYINLANLRIFTVEDASDFFQSWATVIQCQH